MEDLATLGLTSPTYNKMIEYRTTRSGRWNQTRECLKHVALEIIGKKERRRLKVRNERKDAKGPTRELKTVYFVNELDLQEY